MKPKRYVRQAICILRSAQNKRSNENNWTLFRKTLKSLVIVHMSSVGAMVKLCMYNSIWQEEFKWARVMFLTCLKSWNNSLRKDTFLVKQNCACFLKDILISLHLVDCQSLALQGFLAISSLNWSCDTRLLSQTTLALKSKRRKAVVMLFDFPGQTFSCEICCCKTSLSFRVRMGSWIKWLSLLSTLKIGITIMTETKSTDKRNTASRAGLMCVSVSRQGDCIFTQSYPHVQ